MYGENFWSNLGKTFKNFLPVWIYANQDTQIKPDETLFKPTILGNNVLDIQCSLVVC